MNKAAQGQPIIIGSIVKVSKHYGGGNGVVVGITKSFLTLEMGSGKSKGNTIYLHESDVSLLAE